MIDIGDVRTRFRDNCADYFLSNGFKYFKKREAFRKIVSSEIEHLAHFRIIKTTQVLIEPSFSIRQMKIESLFHEVMGTPKKFIDMTSVLWPRATMLVPNMPEEILYCVDSDEKVIDSANAFVTLYRDYARKFFDSHSTLEEIDYVLNCAPLEPCTYQPSPLHRSCFGAIVSIMLNGSEAATGIIEAYSNVLETVDNGIHLQKYHYLVDVAKHRFAKKNFRVRSSI